MSSNDSTGPIVVPLDGRLDLLERLAELRKSGTLTEAEFLEEKRRVLAGDQDIR
ncbi:MAG TPA: SHOCT domain-containing protein [Tepidiformaceae bacterium]